MKIFIVATMLFLVKICACVGGVIEIRSRNYLGDGEVLRVQLIGGGKVELEDTQYTVGEVIDKLIPLVGSGKSFASVIVVAPKGVNKLGSELLEWCEAANARKLEYMVFIYGDKSEMLTESQVINSAISKDESADPPIEIFIPHLLLNSPEGFGAVLDLLKHLNSESGPRFGYFIYIKD